MADGISVRLGIEGGMRFRQEFQQAGAAGEASMRRIGAASGQMRGQLQNAAFQVGDFFVQVAAGTSATRAFAMQAPQMLGGFGAIGAVGGAAVAVMAAMVPLMSNGADEAGKMADEFRKSSTEAGNLESSISALRGVQDAYADAIRGGADASTAAADIVIASSAREFAARKSLLEVELAIQKARAGTMLAARETLRSSVTEITRETLDSNSDLINMRTTGAAGLLRGGVDRAGNRLDAYVNIGPRTIAETGVTTDLARQVAEATAKERLALKKAEAEYELLRIQIEKTEALMATDFSGLTADSSAGKPPKKSRGGGGKSPLEKMLEEAKKLFEETRTPAERYAAEIAKLNVLLEKGAIDQDTYNRKVAQLREEYDSAAKFAASVSATFKSSMSSLFDAIVEGGGKAGDVIEGLGKKLMSMALQESTFRLLARLMPGTFGAGGFVPLVGSAMGNIFDGGRIIPFATGGVVTSPILFPMRGATGLMGEAGPEAILPLTRIGGRLGVQAAGAGGGTVVNIINNTGQPVREERSRGPDLREIVRVVVGEEIGAGAFAGPLKARHGVGVTKVRRG